MNKNKSKAAYTTKWLNRNKHLWEEKIPERGIFHHVKIIVLKTSCAPKIVASRIEEINGSRWRKQRSLARLNSALKNLIKKKTSVKDV